MNHYDLLLSKIPPERHQEYRDYLDWIAEQDGFLLDYEFLGFMDDYQKLAEMLESHILSATPEFMLPRDPNFTVFDVGCSTALQHVLFGRMDAYIGIESYPLPEYRFFTDNATVIPGKFSDVIEGLEIPRNAVGIAHMSLLYQSGNEKDIQIFNQTFKRKWIY
jgi:hypothetical protein